MDVNLSAGKIKENKKLKKSALRLIMSRGNFILCKGDDYHNISPMKNVAVSQRKKKKYKSHVMRNELLSTYNTKLFNV